MTEDNIEYAGFWRRFWAYNIDWGILFIPLFICFIILGFFAAVEVFGNLDYSHLGPNPTELQLAEYGEEQFNKMMEGKGTEAILGCMLIWSVLCVLLLAFLGSGKKQASWGKRMMGVYIVKKNGDKFEKPDFMVCLGRYGLIWVISWAYSLAFYDHFFTKAHIFNHIDIIYYSIFLIWYLTVPFTKEKTTIHDMIFKTRVVRGKL